MRVSVMALLTTLAIAGGTSVAAEELAAGQPRAQARVETFTIHSTTIVDPYRWMEADSSEFTEWAAGQHAYTRAVLDRLPLRQEFLKRITELAAARDEVRDVRARAGKYFYLKRPASEDVFKLYVRERGGTERVVVDPRSGDFVDGSSIDYYEPSPTGEHVAFGVSPRGSEDSVLRVVEVATGEFLPDTIDRARHGEPRWRPDGRSFFYRRNRLLPVDAPPAMKYQRARNHIHVLGREPDLDPPVFGFEVSPEVPFAQGDSPYLYTWHGCPYVFAMAQHGTARAMTLYVARLEAVDGPKTPWRRLAGVEDEVIEFAPHGEDVYLFTTRAAPRGMVIRTRIDEPNLRAAHTVIRPSERVVVDLVAASDALYVKLLDGGLSRMMRVPFDKGGARELKLPFEGSADQFAADPAAPGFWCQLQSWTQPRRQYGYDWSTDRFFDLGLVPVSPGAPFPVEARQVKVKSKDGTLVPLSIVHRRGLKPNRPHPTLLIGYGSYGLSIDPSFDPRRLAFLERGGIYAVAHVRGGGEYGEEWHRAGMKQKKQNSVDDFLASARYLVDRGYTSPQHLAAQGTSAGGLTVGAAITQQPELFAAALVRVGIVDALRFETTPVGLANTREFGSSANADEVQPLYAMSPYYQVAEGRPYPSVLFTGAVNDARVPLWQPAKMAARMQAATSSGKPVLLRVEYRAGHGFGFGSTNSQMNEELADCYAFVLSQTSGVGPRSKAASR